MLYFRVLLLYNLHYYGNFSQWKLLMDDKKFLMDEKNFLMDDKKLLMDYKKLLMEEFNSWKNKSWKNKLWKNKSWKYHTWSQCVNNFRYTDPMVDFQISVGAEEKALQDDLLGFSIRWVYGVKSSHWKFKTRQIISKTRQIISKTRQII